MQQDLPLSDPYSVGGQGRDKHTMYCLLTLQILLCIFHFATQSEVERQECPGDKVWGINFPRCLIGRKTENNELGILTENNV